MRELPDPMFEDGRPGVVLGGLAILIGFAAGWIIVSLVFLP